MASADPAAGDHVVSRARYRLRLLRAPESTAGKRLAVGLLFGVTVLIVVLNVTVGSSQVPVLAQVIPIVLGGLLLAPEALLVVLAFVFTAYVLQWTKVIGHNALHVGAFVVLLIVAGIAVILARDRQRLGLSVGRGEQMLYELHDRLRQQSQPPPLPGGWRTDLDLRTEGGGDFGGDFLVSSVSADGSKLELAMVDVSGKGIDAASRALMLSGALGGLLGAVPSDDFLTAANHFLLRQRWSEGFATAVHLVIDLDTGWYRITNAGHPPVVHHRAGMGRWDVIEVGGMVLGVIPDATFDHADGELSDKDALLLYTDGVVEVPGRDLSLGIDKLLGAAERLVGSGFDGGARRLIDDVAPMAADDRAVALLWRS